MIRFNLKELYKANTTSKPFLGNAEQLAHLPFMAEYLANIDGSEIPVFPQIDRNFARMNGSFEPTYNADEIGTDSVDEVLDEFKQDVFALLVRNMEKYKRLYDLSKTEYAPIDNYNMIEESKLDRTGTDTTKKNDGTTKDTYDYGDAVSNVEYGEGTVTEKLGAVSATDNNGEVSVTTTDKVSGYNESGMNDATEQTQVTNPVVNSHTEQARENSQVTAGRTDKTTVQARQDSVTHTQETEATETVEFGSGEKTTLTRKGNIGVTTSQQMAEQEVNLWTRFNFYQVIFDDIIKSLCNRYDGGYDVMETPWLNAMKRGE